MIEEDIGPDGPARVEGQHAADLETAAEVMRALVDNACQGVGIVALPPYVCRDAVLAGLLKRVLPDWSLGPAMMTALLPHRHGMLPLVRAFLDHLSEEVPKIMVV